MRTTDAYADLLALGRPLIESREAASRLGTSATNTSRILRTVADAGLIRRVRQGLWALDPQVAPAVVAPYLTAPMPAYVSGWSALARHDMIEQLPATMFVVSSDRTRRVQTSFGTFEIHHMEPEIVTGFSGSPSDGYWATAEKALFDSVYLRAPAGGRIYFPELSLPEDFDADRLQGWLSLVQRPRLRTLVAQGLDQALGQSVDTT